MVSALVRRPGAIVVSAMLLASLAIVTTSAPASAKASCGGERATIVGTKRGEVIRGTPKRDVIVARGGHDIIFGRGGGDIICGNGGNDRIFGGPGNDQLYGQAGNDRLVGARGQDRVFGGTGSDRLFGGPANDLLNGGTSIDACHQQTGIGPYVFCERPPVPDPPKVLAIAYSDLDGNHTFSGGDVLISQVLDTTGDGIPSRGDTIEMGTYPVVFNPASSADFHAWGISQHTVATAGWRGDRLWVGTEADNSHGWFAVPGQYQSYEEHAPGHPVTGYASATIADVVDGTYTSDWMRIDAGSPSEPTLAVRSQEEPAGKGDDRFIDVEILP